MKQVTAIVLGAGDRGTRAYAPYSLQFPHELKIVGVAEVNGKRRQQFAQMYRLEEKASYSRWEDLLQKPRMADVAIITTQDRLHYAPAMKALEKGYHVLLEKPMSPDPEECIRMERKAAETGRLLTICHVLRYTPFWSAIKGVIDQGKIGDVVSIQLNENVGYQHMAHSFVRGNWRRSDRSSPMILAKSCHDLDLLAWLVGAPCERVSSFGSLTHFTEKNAPKEAPHRCLDGCPAEPHCPYYAPRFYLGEGRDWARKITETDTEEGILEALRSGPYGRCVYRSDNNVVDHQVVNMEFANGATATFSMCGFTQDITRIVQIMGTKGEIRGNLIHNRFTLYDFLTRNMSEIRVHAPGDSHGGGDYAVIRHFLQQVRHPDGQESLTSAKASVQSHLMAFAAEESRLHQGKVIELEDYASRMMGG
ncbi:MAG: Gfo/Idh/MocA family oxidoreductase [Firmicutes bacterium]|uniref:Oxidoreductase family, C-terminal alpha/beta domain n=1 Tax=Melghirimyces thermohalophilus TaxID=1236220 RepID=A0A1G6QNN2_9BACL|nr:Gfo/Idh/MocA family oxidoreductase [Melghirimyces thermohalophilus]MDA8354652.1 Gfo/Idh/MocA family oxidoreductase [Bacillota bacterium]SDC93295.1 Oxidoreductase family, C-terminal alpha/beta domain [Melghirimyces thermohalophilus]